MKGKKTKKEREILLPGTLDFDWKARRISVRLGDINPFFLSAHRLEFPQALPVRNN